MTQMIRSPRVVHKPVAHKQCRDGACASREPHLLASAILRAIEPPASRDVDVARHAAFDAIIEYACLRHDFDHEGRITAVNANLCRATSYSSAELIGAGHALLQPVVRDGGLVDVDMRGGSSRAACSQKGWRELHVEVEADQLWSGEVTVLAKDGRDVCLSSTIAAVRCSDGHLVGYTCVSVDVTEARNARDELKRHSKLMQLGQLTATVAHEIRNPLGAIRTASFVLERRIKGTVEGVAPQLERINTGIQRCDKIISELLDISRVKTLKRQPLTVDHWLVKTIEEDCKDLAGSPTITYDLTLGQTVARFDPDQIRQVLVNILSNAAEAMTEKTHGGEGYRPLIVVSTRMAGGIVEIAVTDNGPGIEPRHMTRVREPLFTTKSFGVGLGIPAIERILENHGGSLTIKSVFGSGATVVAGFAQGAIEGSADAKSAA